jgi:hypothetical protein
MLRGNANEIVKGKANQRDKESTDTNNGGGFQYSLPDTVRLRKKIILIIKEHFSRGATWLDIKGEAIYIELDNFTAEYLVPDRRKQSALKDLVKEGRLTAKEGRLTAMMNLQKNKLEVCMLCRTDIKLIYLEISAHS